MTCDPINILKRKLDDENTPITKRLCLAKNVVKTNHFPVLSKEKVLSEWLTECVTKKELNVEDFKDLLNWISVVEDMSNDLKSQLIQIVVHYLKQNGTNQDIYQPLMQLIENRAIAPQLQQQITNYINITTILLKHFKEQEIKANIHLIKQIFVNMEIYYKSSKKKLEIITNILNGEILEIIFELIEHEELKEIATNLCQTLLFPMNKKTYFALFLRTLLQKENIDELIGEKGDNIQSVLKVMTSFFTFPNGRTTKDPKFLEKFIYTFVSSFKSEKQIVFAFYIMVSSSLNFEQSYLSPNMKMPPILFENNDTKVKRNLFLKMLNTLIENEIDVNVKLTDTLGESGSRVEIKKSFCTFLLHILLGLVKLEGKIDKTSLEIITSALKLDPSIIESKLDKILPPLMASKKNNANLESYTKMINYLLEIMFKLSKGVTFLSQILPGIKIILEAGNTEQFELQQMSNQDESLIAKIITGFDILPQESIEVYGKLTSELMYRQSKDVLLVLQKELEVHCLMMLEEGFVSPSIITLAEVLSAILCSFFERNKMADHTVPGQIAEEFWLTFDDFENNIMKRFGKCVLKLNFNPRLAHSFLKLCASVAELKLLNLQYRKMKMDSTEIAQPFAENALDLSNVLTFLDGKEWLKLTEKINDDNCKLILVNLLSLKIATQNVLYPGNSEEMDGVKSEIIKELPNSFEFLHGNTPVLSVLFSNTNSQILKQASKIIIKYVTKNEDMTILENEAISNNKVLLNTLTMEILRITTKLVENDNADTILHKALTKNDFDITVFLEKIKNVAEYFESFTKDTSDLEIEITNYLFILKHINIYNLDENTQLTAIFILLAIKKNSHNKKNKKTVDYILQSIFELSTKNPDLTKLFPIEYIFDFENKTILNLLTLKIKTSNTQLLIKSTLETAVKKVKTNSEIVKIIVKILLSNQKVKKENERNINCFSDEVFQITCLILPIIAKEKRAITTSNYRTILAELQEKLHKSLLKSFKSINFENERCSLLTQAGNTEDSVVVSENAMATLNAMEAFSLTLAKYCESNDADEIKNLDSLWNGMEFFVQNAILSIKNPETKPYHIDSSIQLLNVIQRYIKKLETHSIFQSKDALLLQIWQSVKSRLLLVYQRKVVCQKGHVNESYVDDLGVTIKFICEISSVDGFVKNVCSDLYNLMIPLKTAETKNNKDQLNTTLVNHEVARFLWNSTLKANITGPKCIAMSKSIYRTCRNLSNWIRQHFEKQSIGRKESSSNGRNFNHNVARVDSVATNKNSVASKNNVTSAKSDLDENEICKIIRIDLDTLSEVVLSAKKIPLNYKFMDVIFELQHSLQPILDSKSTGNECKIALHSFVNIFEGALNLLNSLIVSRDELLEDRWPCFLQCYRALIWQLCEASSANGELSKPVEDKLAELAHSIEKLTQSISKRKAHTSRLAAYTIGDICSYIEKTTPTRSIRQHLENSVSLFLQSTDTNHALSFLRRGLAGEPGQMTLTYLYNLYKRYHKYVGNS